MRVIGLMCGTSYDAVDAVGLDFQLAGEQIRVERLGFLSQPVPAPLRADIAAVLPPGRVEVGALCRLDTGLGQLFASTAARAVQQLGPVDLIASHGQTVYHWVDDDGVARGTLQLGAPAWIAAATGSPVVADFRTADIARGGQGAPLVTMLDELLILTDRPRRVALNLGGIANLSVRVADRVLSWDLGPAGALLDAAVAAATGGVERMDRDGAHAARGRVHPDALRALLDEPYYAAAPPKSTGKELFHSGYVTQRLAGLDSLGLDDLCATLTELTAELVARECRRYDVDELVVGGGGLRNPRLMGRIEALAGPTEVGPVDAYGLPAAEKEAAAFALLGFLTVHGLPGTVAGATGADRPVVLGSITPGREPLRLPAPATTAPTRLVITR